MGHPMARNLLRAGHRVALWSNTAAKAKQLAEEEKGVACDSPKQVAEASRVPFSLCVGDTQMSEDVLLAPDGVIHGAKPGTVVADASTISPSASRAIGKQAGRQGHPLPGCSLHRIHAGRHGGHPDLHGWRAIERFLTKRSPYLRSHG